MKKAAYEVALKSKEEIAEGTWAFTFEKPAEFRFKAGQHVRMTLLNPPETDAEGDSRFLSIASTPGEQKLVFAMRMRDTAFKRVLAQLPIGEKVKIEILLGVPHGAFALHDDASKPAVFLVGGIGIVPAYSMIKDAIERNLAHKLVLFYSNRRPEDAPFLAELQTLAKHHSSFTLVATMTEPEKSGKGWHGETGFIDRDMLKKYLNDLASPIYYIAGMPQMVDAMKVVLTDAGVSDDSVHAEEFSGFKMGEHSASDHIVMWQRHLPHIAIAVVIIVLVIFHTGAIFSLSKINLGTLTLQNPLLYLMIGFLLGIIATFKLKHMMSLMHGRKK